MRGLRFIPYLIGTLSTLMLELIKELLPTVLTGAVMITLVVLIPEVIVTIFIVAFVATSLYIIFGGIRSIWLDFIEEETE